MDENNRAYGVAYTRHGIPQIAHASKEVILSAGAFQSPMILMKSGIGPTEVLKEAGVSNNFLNKYLHKTLYWFVILDSCESNFRSSW